MKGGKSWKNELIKLDIDYNVFDKKTGKFTLVGHDQAFGTSGTWIFNERCLPTPGRQNSFDGTNGFPGVSHEECDVTQLWHWGQKSHVFAQTRFVLEDAGVVKFVHRRFVRRIGCHSPTSRRGVVFVVGHLKEGIPTIHGTDYIQVILAEERYCMYFVQHFVPAGTSRS